MPEAANTPAAAAPSNTNANAPAKANVTTFAKPPGETKPAETKAPEGGKPADDVDPRDLWRKATSGKTFKHKGAEKKLEELDPDEAFEMIRRGYGASELVNEAKKTQTEAQKILAAKKAIAEGDDDAALEAILELGGKRGIQLLDRLRSEMAERAKEEETLTPKERELAARLQKTEEEAAQLKRDQQKRQKDEEERSFKAEEAKTKTEALGKVNELFKLLKGFPAEKKDLLGPFVARAWREAIETGAELGRDIDAEAIIKRAEKLFRGSTSDFYGKLSTNEQFDFLGEEAVRKLSIELVRRTKGAPKPAAPAAVPAKKPDSTREAPQLGDPRYLNR